MATKKLSLFDKREYPAGGRACVNTQTNTLLRLTATSPKGRNLESRRMVLGITAGVLSGTAAFSVKKRRLFERSEFLRFS